MPDDGKSSQVCRVMPHTAVILLLCLMLFLLVFSSFTGTDNVEFLGFPPSLSVVCHAPRNDLLGFNHSPVNSGYAFVGAEEDA